MLANKVQLLLGTIRRLVRRGNVQNLRKLVLKTRPEDLAVGFQFLGELEREHVFGVIPAEELEYCAELIGTLDPALAAAVLQSLKVERAVEILRKIPSDDVADILGEFDEERAEALLARMKDQESDQLAELMHYGDDTAGGIMSPDFFSLPEKTTAQEAIEQLREATDVEMAFYIYVRDEHGHLVGCCSLRQLVVTAPDTPLSEIMTPNVIRVNTETDQEEVARLVHRYGFLAVPVVDEHNLLVGIVTVDDIIDVIREEATEDILKMAGAGYDLSEEQSPMRAVRNRLPWLFAAWIGGVASIWVIGAYEEQLHKLAVLAAFIPVIMGMGGNIGNQAAALVVRGLALGRISVGQLGWVLGTQTLVGAILGVFFGGLLGVVAYVLFGQESVALGVGPIRLPLVVGLAIWSQMLIAAFLGTLLPMVFERFKVDPAVATGPFVTTSMDIIGIVVYFNIAVLFLNLA
ncbi:magnesium transporter [Planctomycetota bacterium]